MQFYADSITQSNIVYENISLKGWSIYFEHDTFDDEASISSIKKKLKSRKQICIRIYFVY